MGRQPNALDYNTFAPQNYANMRCHMISGPKTAYPTHSQARLGSKHDQTIVHTDPTKQDRPPNVHHPYLQTPYVIDLKSLYKL
eukprot:1186311-Karenia_brevis.AAC.1